DDVQCIGCAALEQDDEHLTAGVAVERGAFEQVLGEHRPSEKRRVQPHRCQGHCARLHEHSSIHRVILENKASAVILASVASAVILASVASAVILASVASRGSSFICSNLPTCI